MADDSTTQANGEDEDEETTTIIRGEPEVHETHPVYVILRKWIIAAIAILAVSSVVGHLRLETQIDNERDFQRAQEERRREDARVRCQSRNTGNQVARDTVVINANQQYDALLAEFPDAADTIDRLRENIFVPPAESQDSDCNENGYLDRGDYLPPPSGIVQPNGQTPED